MAPIRVAIQSNPSNVGEQLPALLEDAKKTRAEAGCLQFEHFRGTEFPEHLLLLELWESPATLDAYWKRVVEQGVPPSLLALQSPHRHGTQHSPREHGQNGVEIYPHAYMERIDNVFMRQDEARRIEHVRWPAWGAIRIIIQLTSDPATDPPVQHAIETREEPGCLQYENFRSIEYPENLALMELWSSPEIYDIHWLNRLMQFARAAESGAAPAPPPIERRYGRRGIEWYHHGYFTLIDNVWLPENPAQRMLTVRW